MTLRRPPPSCREGGTTERWGKGIRRSRTAHSNYRASKYRTERFRERFDQFRSSQRTDVTDITSQEFESWSQENEHTTRDITIIRAEEAAFQRRIQQATVPRIGTLATIRPHGVWRLMYCQVNCLGLSAKENTKALKIADLVREFDVDTVALCEVGIDWHFGHWRDLKDYFDHLLDRECKTTSACNESSPHVSRAQQGGTGTLLTSLLLEYGQQCEHDFWKLGRWSSWTLSHTPSHRTRLVVAYCPGKSKPKGPKTVYR
jgi:hypothetical protein